MLRVSEPAFLGREVEYATEALVGRNLSMGTYVRKFEGLAAKYAGTKYAVACSSGTTALHLALLSLGVKDGDEVVMPTCSYIATANAVRYCGGVPVFVDVLPGTWTIDPEMAEQARTPRTVGAIIVNLYGVLSDIPSGFPWVLEDSCEAHGLNLRTGVGVLSYYGNKIITCGEGGVVVTDASEIASRAALLRGQGTTGRRRYVHEVVGYNYRLTDLQAAVGCGQYENIRAHLTMRLMLQRRYRSLIGSMMQTRPVYSADWVCPIRVSNRDVVAQRLYEMDIETRPVFPGIHTQLPYNQGQVFPVAQKLAEEGLLLPLHPNMTEEDVDTVCRALGQAQKMAA